VDLPQPSMPSNVMNKPFGIFDLRFTIFQVQSNLL